ncbi:DUF6266 family protein [Parapedobacter sp. DT-150]|uniref:DUF6266 family protein n=1 Tax=Parapedobacter sp. DT-150 TaxID=3396162 RepID=UPI003F1C0293
MDFFYDKNRPKATEKTYGKLAVQQRMRLAMAFLNPLRSIVAEGWASQGKGNKSKAFGQALKNLMHDALEGQYPEQRIIPERVLISMGILPGVQVEDVVIGQHELEIHFSSETNPLAGAGDEVVLVVYSPEEGIAGRNTEACTRSDGTLRVELPPPLWGIPFHAYLFACNARKRQYSKSVYIGQLGG